MSDPAFEVHRGGTGAMPALLFGTACFSLLKLRCREPKDPRSSSQCC